MTGVIQLHRRGNSPQRLRLSPRRRAWRGAGSCWVFFFFAFSACSGLTVNEKLRRSGLQVLSEDAALVPPEERGRFLPCRVLRGFTPAPLPEHEASYLIVGVDGRRAASAAALRAALRAWDGSRPLRLWVRRNPHQAATNEWWEGDVWLGKPRSKPITVRERVQ